MTHGVAALGVAIVVAVGAASSTTLDARERPRVGSRTIGGTQIVGDCDARVWAPVLDLLPSRPARVEVVDLDRLSAGARQRVAGLQAFVIPGQKVIYVVRQGASLRMAELGDGVDQLILASVIWHEMGHLEGLDEDAATAREQGLWRTFIAAGRVDSALGLTYVARLGERRLRRRGARPSTFGCARRRTGRVPAGPGGRERVQFAAYAA